MNLKTFIERPVLSAVKYRGRMATITYKKAVVGGNSCTAQTENCHFVAKSEDAVSKSEEIPARSEEFLTPSEDAVTKSEDVVTHSENVPARSEE
jgi:hypothetical protein